jgi:hypothetical protein
MLAAIPGISNLTYFCVTAKNGRPGERVRGGKGIIEK